MSANAMQERTLADGDDAIDYTFVAGDGTGIPLVLLHPWFGAPAFWDETVAALPAHDRYVVHQYSLRGGAWDGERGPRGIARAVETLLEREQLGPVAVAGNSTGGIVAQLVAASRPERVETLVLIGTGARTAGVTPDYRAELDAWLAGDPDGSKSAALVRRLLAKDPPPERLAAYVAAVNGADREHMETTLRGVLAGDLRPLLGRIAARTLVIRGALDAGRTREHVQELLDGIPRCIEREVAGAGHAVMVDEPDLVAAMIAAQVAGTEVPGTAFDGARPRSLPRA